jgi:putative FmdB family regulatory protein
MPTYSYRCNACDRKWDRTHSMGESLNGEKCFKMDCQGVLVKVFQSTPVHFRGSGFYKTDSK